MPKPKPQQTPAQPPTAIQSQPSSAQPNTANLLPAPKPNKLETLIVIALTIFAVMLLFAMVSPNSSTGLYAFSLIGCIGTFILLVITNKRARKTPDGSHQYTQSNVHLQSKPASETIPASPNPPQAQAPTSTKSTNTSLITIISLLVIFAIIIIIELTSMQPGGFPILTCFIAWFGVPILIIMFIIKYIINHTRKK